MTTQAIDPALTRAYETCRRMHRRFDPTYYWATRRLPEEIRPATHALYGYVRTADQIVDGPRRDGRPEARRAALDAWEAELEAGLAAGHSSQPVVGALVDAGRRHRLPLGELRLYMRSMRLDCAPVRIETLGRARRLHGGLGRLGRAHHGAAARRPRARTTRASARSGSPSSTRTSSATCARTGGSTASTCRPRTARRFGVEEADFDRPAATPELRALVAHEVRRARGLFASAEAAVEAAPASVRPGHPAGLHDLPRRARPRRGARLRRARPPPAAAGLAAPARRAGGAAAMTRRATLRGEERTPLDERADVLICGASFAGLAVARELAGSGADVLVIDRYEIGERQTSACAIPTPWLEPMGIRRAARQELDVHELPHAARHGAPPAAVELDVVRLPDAVRGAVGAVRRPLRGREGRAPRGRHGHTDRGPLRAPADRRRPRLAPRARPGRQRAAAGGAHLARARGAPGGRRRRPRRLDRPLADPARLRVVGARPTASSASASAPTSRATTSRSRRARSPRASACRRSATRATGSRTSCARRSRTACSSSATAPATASRSPARASAPRSTSASPAAASCARCWPASARATPRSPPTARSPAATRAPSRGRWRSSARSPPCRRGCSRACSRSSAAAASATRAYGWYLRQADPAFAARS